MKKFITLILVFALVSVALFADAEESFINEYKTNTAAYSGIGSGFKHSNPEILGMGGAGVALTDSSKAFLLNPASITEGKFRLFLPSATFTLYHVYDFLKPDSEGKSFINKAMNSSDNMGDLITDALDIVGIQFTPFIRVDASTGVVIPIGKFAFGLNVNASNTVYTYSGSVIDEINSEVALAFGYKLELGDLSLAIGLDGKYSILAFNSRIKATDLMDLSDGFTLTLASGAAPVFDIGTTVKYKGWSFGAALRDINFAGYKMSVSTEELSGVVGAVFKGGNDGDITVEITPDLTMGFGYTLETRFVDFKAAFDLSDMVGLSKYSGTEPGKALFKHLNAGVEVGLFDTLYIRTGLNSGYWTTGLSLDIFVIRLEAAYYWKEMGSIAGQKGLDGLTIKFNLGYDR